MTVMVGGSGGGSDSEGEGKREKKNEVDEGGGFGGWSRVVEVEVGDGGVQ